MTARLTTSTTVKMMSEHHGEDDDDNGNLLLGPELLLLLLWSSELLRRPELSCGESYQEETHRPQCHCLEIISMKTWKSMPLQIRNGRTMSLPINN